MRHLNRQKEVAKAIASKFAWASALRGDREAKNSATSGTLSRQTGQSARFHEGLRKASLASKINQQI